MGTAGTDQDRSPRVPGEQARQGEIVLTTRRRRVIFIAGLAALVLFPLAAMLLGG